MFHKVIEHSRRYPEATPLLMLSILPFLALTVHDSVRFVRKYFDATVPLDSNAVNRLRNASKALSSKGLHIEEYALEAKAITSTLTASAKNHSGLFGDLLNAMQPDIAIVYCNGLPVSTSYNVARYVGRADGGLKGVLANPDVVSRLGFDIGQAASVNYYTVAQLGIEESSLVSNKFEAESLDLHFSDLLIPLSCKGISNIACFFMLSDILTQLNSITVLRSSGFFSDALQMKFATTVLLAACRSISKFSRCVKPKPDRHECTSEGAEILSTMIPKSMRKEIERTSDLRNAFVHYDFSKLLDSKLGKCHDAGTILEMAIQSSVQKSVEEYLAWIVGTVDDLSKVISTLIELPAYGSSAGACRNVRA